MSNELSPKDFKYTDKPVIGVALILHGGTVDSFGDKIDGEKMYLVGKHQETGEVAIIPTGARFDLPKLPPLPHKNNHRP